MAAPEKIEIPEFLRAPIEVAKYSEPWWKDGDPQSSAGNYATNKSAAQTALARALAGSSLNIDVKTAANNSNFEAVRSGLPDKNETQPAASRSPENTATYKTANDEVLPGGVTISQIYPAGTLVAVPISGAPVSKPVTNTAADARLFPESNFTDSMVSVIPPSSMAGSALEAEIEKLRMLLGMPALSPDAPRSEMADIYDSDGQLRFDRLQTLEAEYFDRRRLLEIARAATKSVVHQQREPGPDASDVMGLASVMMNPTMAAPALATEAASSLLGHPVEDFATGFLPGFLGGAVLELPRDAFEKLDAETKEHPILFNGGVLAGIPVGAGKGLVDMIVGLAELLGLAVRFSPVGMAWQGMKDAYSAGTDPTGYQAEQKRKLDQARAVGRAIVSLIESLISDPAFMISHGRELGEIAGRSAAQWFNEDYMQRSTFDKGYTVGYVEGRILFEIIALFFGPEEWIARGSVAVGEVARLSRPLRTAILEAIERIPALRPLLTLGREGATAMREAGTAERALVEGGEAISDASRASQGAADLGRGSGTTGDSARALEKAADDGCASCRADDAAELAKPKAEPEKHATVEPKPLDAADLAEVGPINNETRLFFREHPDRLKAWAHNSEATRVCKLCHSPCFPKNVTASQTERLEVLVERARAKGITIEDHALHDTLSVKSEDEIEIFIDGFRREMDGPMPGMPEAGKAPNVKAPAPKEAPPVSATPKEAPVPKEAPAPKEAPVLKEMPKPQTAAQLKELGIKAEAPIVVKSADFSKVKLKPGQKALYIIRDADGSILKVGKTSETAITGRFRVYKNAEEIEKTAIQIEVYPLKPSPKKAQTFETALREKLVKEGHAMPWDNTGNRLGRSGFGTPGEGVRTPPVSKEKLIELLTLYKGNRRETGKALAKLLGWDGVHQRTVGMWANSYGIKTAIYK